MTKKPIRPSTSARSLAAVADADGDVVASGVACQNRLEEGQQRHVKRGARLPTQCAEPVGEFGRDPEFDLIGAIGQDGGRGRSVGSSRGSSPWRFARQ